MVARTRPPAFQVLAAWEPAAPPAPKATKAPPPRPVLPAPSPAPVPQLALPVGPPVLALPAARSPPMSPPPEPPKVAVPAPTPGLYDLPGLLARIVSASAALHAAGSMQLGIPEPRPPPPLTVRPAPSLAELAVKASVLLDDRPRAKTPPPPAESMLAALPVYHWRDWHRPAPSSPEAAVPVPQSPTVAPLPRSFTRPDHPPQLADRFPPQAGGCKCPQCHVADPTVALRGTIARQRHLRFEPTPEAPTPPRAPAGSPGELVPSARLAVDRWKPPRLRPRKASTSRR
jgi:hypothetical protein